MYFETQYLQVLKINVSPSSPSSGGSYSVNWPRFFTVFGGSCTESWIGVALLSSFCNSGLNLNQLNVKLGLVSWWSHMGSSGMMSVQSNLARWDTPCTLCHSLCGTELHLFPYETNRLSRTGYCFSCVSCLSDVLLSHLFAVLESCSLHFHLPFKPSSPRLCNCTILWFSRHWRLPCSNLCHCHWGFVSTIEIDICINVRLSGLQTSFDGILHDLLSRPFSTLLWYSFSMHRVMYKWWTNS